MNHDPSPEDQSKLDSPASSVVIGGPQDKTNSKLGAVVGPLILILLFAAASYGVFAWQQSKLKQQDDQVALLKSQIASVQKQVSSLQTTSLSKTTDTKKLSLDSGKVSFTLPDGWVKATAKTFNNFGCNGGSVDSKVLCEDVAVALPKDLNHDITSQDKSAPFNVGIEVYQKSDDKSAKVWLDTVFDLEFTNTIVPKTINADSSKINGYDAFSYSSVGDNYTNTYYCVVKGNLAVVISMPTKTQDQDNSQYLPAAKQLINSISMSN